MYDMSQDANRTFIGDRLRNLEDENHRLSDTLHACLEDISTLRSSQPPRTVCPPADCFYRSPLIPYAE